MKSEKVYLYISVYGDNPSDMRVSVLFDITNDIQFDDYTEEELDRQASKHDDYRSIRLVSGFKVGKKYFYNI